MSKQHLPVIPLVIDPLRLMVELAGICQTALGIPLKAARETRTLRLAITSCISTVKLDSSEHILLSVNCDDKLLEMFFEKLPGCTMLTLGLKDTLHVLDELTKTVSAGLVSILHHATIVSGILEHARGCIHIEILKLECVPGNGVGLPVFVR